MRDAAAKCHYTASFHGTRRRPARSIEESESDSLGPLLVDRLSRMTPTVRAAGIGVLLSRPAWTTALVDALAAGNLAWTIYRSISSGLFPSTLTRQLRKRAEELLAAGGVLPIPTGGKCSMSFCRWLRSQVMRVRGKQVFLKHCAKCHVHGERGTRIGPDLTGMAVHPKAELLEKHSRSQPQRGRQLPRLHRDRPPAGRCSPGLLRLGDRKRRSNSSTLKARSIPFCAKTSTSSWRRRSR